MNTEYLDELAHIPNAIIICLLLSLLSTWAQYKGWNSGDFVSPICAHQILSNLRYILNNFSVEAKFSFRFTYVYIIKDRKYV